MDGQRQKSGWGRRRRRKPPRNEPRAVAEPVLIAARRPDSPRLTKGMGRTAVASAVPKKSPVMRVTEPPPPLPENEPKPEAPKRMARIVQVTSGTLDERERERLKLFQRLMTSEGRGAISRAANEYIQAGFDIPDEQETHLQLLEHFDESRARDSLSALTRLLREQPPRKRPVLDQRLRRMEEHADELATRELAAELRRTLRS